jgi:hypothetical protein
MSEAAVNETLPLPSEAEALASLREFALGPITAVFTWSEAAAILELLDRLTNSGVIEVAVRNPSVMEYMRDWEGRAEKAEAAEAKLREELRSALDALGTETARRLAHDRFITDKGLWQEFTHSTAFKRAYSKPPPPTNQEHGEG